MPAYKLSRTAPVLVALTAAFVAGQLNAQSSAAPRHAYIRVQAAPSLSAPVSGRLLVFLKAGSGDKEVTTSEFNPLETSVAAREIKHLVPGETVDVDVCETAYPKPFCELPAGNYEAQAVLDVDHSYNYKDRTPEDWESTVAALPGWSPAAATEPVLVLDRHPEVNPQRAAMMARVKQQATPDVAQLQEFESPLLTKFWGRPVKIRAWVILPPGYGKKPGTWPTVYWTHGFGGNIDSSLVTGLRIYERMKGGGMPPMIWVMLDESIAQGTHEFADSVNNGPWGAALTREFIPYLEKKYKMDARANGRFLNGHSSGGWATLQLEINYSKVFGGTWSTSPDPSDFHDFTGIDLYAPNANVFKRADGTAFPIFRDKGKVVATAEQMVKLEDVLGPYGGQMTSFDWVFSPKSPSGAPMQLFDHVTGEVHPEVLAYWREHYDLAHVVETTWAERGADLKGRIHVYVGTADTFYLDGAAHKLDAVLQRLGADAHFTFVPERTHFDLYGKGQDRNALYDEIAKQMWDVARPGKSWK